MSKRFFEELEEKMNKKFKGAKLLFLGNKFNLPENMTLTNFLNKFITSYNNYLTTKYISGRNNVASTGTRRSINDIYRLAKYYYPECTLKDVIKWYYVDAAKIKVHVSYCTTIFKHVMTPTPYYSNYTDETDQYGNTRIDYLNAIKEYEKI